jgi:hypothetical protein
MSNLPFSIKVTVRRDLVDQLEQDRDLRRAPGRRRVELRSRDANVNVAG